MPDVKRIATLESGFEADLVEHALMERGIRHIVRSYHDAAFDGLFQIQKGWGCIEAAEADEQAVLEVIEGVREEVAARAEQNETPESDNVAP